MLLRERTWIATDESRWGFADAWLQKLQPPKWNSGTGECQLEHHQFRYRRCTAWCDWGEGRQPSHPRSSIGAECETGALRNWPRNTHTCSKHLAPRRFLTYVGHKPHPCASELACVRRRELPLRAKVVESQARRTWVGRTQCHCMHQRELPSQQTSPASGRRTCPEGARQQPSHRATRTAPR